MELENISDRCRDTKFYQGITELIKNEEDGALVFFILLQMSIECYSIVSTNGSLEKFSDLSTELFEFLNSNSK